VASVLAANRAFYDAFERRDLDAMSDVWERSDRALCVHPGWAPLRGWGRVSSSFFALFQGPSQLQFILTDERAEVAGDTAWVSVDENILGDQTGAMVSGLNLFSRVAGGPWLMVCHHGSVVSVPSDPAAG
jgi:ketosteroid isomerase-like protein